MARGRKPDTDAQQAQKGAPGKRMTQAETVAIRSGSPRVVPLVVGNVRPPKWLKKSRKATEVWNDLAPRLSRLNLLSELDALPLGRYCRYVVEWIAADVAVQKEGTWYDAVGTNGETLKKRHPAWQACQDIEKMLRETEASFGMRPDARYKIMRDQAASHGVLPLFGDDDNRDRAPAPPEGGPPPEEEALGLLGTFDSVPPSRPN